MLFVSKSALLHGFVNQDACCHGYVKRFDVAEQRNLNPFVAQGEVFVRHSRIFRPHDDAGRRGIIALRIIVITFFGSGNNLKSAFF